MRSHSQADPGFCCWQVARRELSIRSHSQADPFFFFFFFFADGNT